MKSQLFLFDSGEQIELKCQIVLLRKRPPVSKEHFKNARRSQICYQRLRSSWRFRFQSLFSFHPQFTLSQTFVTIQRVTRSTLTHKDAYLRCLP